MLSIIGAFPGAATTKSSFYTYAMHLAKHENAIGDPRVQAAFA